MTRRKITFTIVVVLALGFVAQRAQAIGLEIEPLVGYERVQMIVPTAHTVDRLTYGALLTAGLPLISIEGEFLRAEDTESFPSESLTVKETTDRAKLGLRSRIRLVNFLSAWARAGGEARRRIRVETRSGTTSRNEDAIKYSPYAGAGLRIHFSSIFALNAGVTVVFVNFPEMGHNEYQSTLGFTIRLGNTKRR